MRPPVAAREAQSPRPVRRLRAIAARRLLALGALFVIGWLAVPHSVQPHRVDASPAVRTVAWSRGADAITQAPPVSALPAAPAPTPSPSPSTAATSPGGTVTVKVGNKPSQSITIILLLTVLSVAPALLVLTTSFTKIIVVLSLTRNALGATNIPPNQVLAGLALFLSLFIMGPTFSQINKDGIQPYLHGQKTQSQAVHDGSQPLHDFMLRQTHKDELATMTSLSKEPKPKTPDDVPFTTLIPAFILSELKAAFIIGFVVFLPFLIIDLVVSSSLMSMGMMMLPPTLVSLPFKLLLFVMVDGWGLIVRSLVQSYH